MLSGLSEIPTNHFFIQIRLHFIHSFISTHPRRVWLSCLPEFGQTRRFNPHTHEGCDPCCSIFRWHGISFNPHTHEGCDSILVWLVSRAACFNPHTHEGCDYFLQYCLFSQISFQSTHPRRVWHPIWCMHHKNSEFQSTHPRRVWPVCFISFHPSLMFQSTHPRRVWLSQSK